MMMAGGVAEHKRSGEGGFLLLNREGGGAHRRQTHGAGAASHCGAAGAKRPRNSSEGGGAAAPMSLRERKDKIGDRVAALQQLVSPFGKTDTASVLHEATGYIKFLHDQLEVLSAPYLQTPPLVDSQDSTSDHYTLRSRGLCLVPVECTLKLAGSCNGADMWAPTNTGNRKL